MYRNTNRKKIFNLKNGACGMAVITVSLSVVVMACNPQRNDNSEAYKQEMTERKLQRVTEGELMNFAQKVGKLAIDSSTNSAIRTELTQWGFAIDTLFDIRFSKTIKEAEVWQAYQYNAESGLAVEPNLQKDGDTLLFYTLPVVADCTLQALYIVRMPKKQLIKNFTDKEPIF